MPVYASTPAFVDRTRHPFLLGGIVVAHVAVIAAVMTARMDIIPTIFDPPTKVTLVPLPEPPPPPQPQKPREPVQPSNSAPLPVPPVVAIPNTDGPTIQPTPIPLPPQPGPIGPTIDPIPQPQPAPKADPVRIGPRFVTRTDDVRPPYPESKRRMEEEASLRLKLVIDSRGRVSAVEPVGRADPVFLEAARRHILARWRYQPATEDGRGIASTTVITLRFELDS